MPAKNWPASLRAILRTFRHPPAVPWGPATWTHNEQGYRQVAPGVTIAVQATAEKLARMALVVGATPELLAGTGQRGREGAVILAKLIAAGPDPDEQLAEAVRSSRDFSDVQKQALIGMIQRGKT